jgi:hypothetical protein
MKKILSMFVQDGECDKYREMLGECTRENGLRDEIRFCKKLTSQSFVMESRQNSRLNNTKVHLKQQNKLSF